MQMGIDLKGIFSQGKLLLVQCSMQTETVMKDALTKRKECIKGLCIIIMEIYKGSWKNDKRDGEGVMIRSDGSRYDGAWRDDMMHGFGRTYSSNGFIRYEGQWAYGKKKR